MPERQADAIPLGIGAKIFQDLTVKRRPGFRCPTFHAGTIVRHFGNVNVGARNMQARVTVSQRCESRKTVSKFSSAIEYALPFFTRVSFCCSAQIPACQRGNFIGLAIFRSVSEPVSSFLRLAKIQQAGRQTASSKRSSRRKFPRE